MPTLTQVIGKKNQADRWVVPPMPFNLQLKEIEQFEKEDKQVRIRLREGLKKNVFTFATKHDVEMCLQQLLNEDRISVIFEDGYNELDNTHDVLKLRHFVPGEVHVVGLKTALHLLNTRPYKYLFEEVESEGDRVDVTLAQPTKPGEMSRIVAGLEEIEALKKELADKIAQVDAKLSAFDDTPPPPPSSRKGKR